MKLINNTIARSEPDRLAHKGCEWFSASKRITRKRERAGLRQMASAELLTFQLDHCVELKEIALHERELAFANVMNRVKRSSRKNAKRSKRVRLSSFVFDREVRFVARIETNSNGNCAESLVLASCAAY